MVVYHTSLQLGLYCYTCQRGYRCVPKQGEPPFEFFDDEVVKLDKPELYVTDAADNIEDGAPCPQLLYPPGAEDKGVNWDMIFVV
ncbi:hypothetical protein ACHAWO_005045 [Cyclotella atomus]|uniref:Uncharacterized protein n=1 Tax=Cyclotella atomus TaxID=382360 RepID=A0ABD3QA97_9STRA